MTLILGIESSCDETAAAVVEDGRRALSNVIASQHDLHRRYGGVVPEIASRAHMERIIPVIDQALGDAGVTMAQVDAVGVGNRPGLIGSLLVGVSAAKALAWALSKPLIGVNHVRAHLYAGTMSREQEEKAEGGRRKAEVRKEEDLFPALGLAVSGGHSNLYALESPLHMTLLGKTIDDAVGEAYDKAAAILELGYPGGPLVDKLAQQGNPRSTDLPRTLLGPTSLDFSFSGLKTALLYAVRGLPRGRGAATTFARSAADLTPSAKADLAASFQHAAIDTLMIKIGRAIEHMTENGQPPRSLLIGGGVSANSLLRRRVLELGAQRGLRICLPPMTLCLDNAAMIAGLAYQHLMVGEVDDLTLPAVATSG
jgi:N6-L-threonylcarbamoyladenine synthase